MQTLQKHSTRNPLLLPELLDHVLDYLDVSHYPLQAADTITGITVHPPCGASRRALLSLAQTCRIVSEPSLDRLWRALGSIIPLAQFFVGVADGERHETAVNASHLLFERPPRLSQIHPPSPSQWANVCRYTVRVKELYVREWETYMLASPESLLRYSPLFSRTFSDSASSGPPFLFPNLKVLIWDCCPISLIEGLLVPGLASLDITFKRAVNTPDSLFERCTLLCPDLKVFRGNFRDNDCEEPNLPVVATLSSFVLRLGKVQSLEIFAPFDPITLKYLILSPNFKALGMMLDHVSSRVDETSITPADTPFPNVEMIALEFWDFYFLTSLLRPRQQRFRNVKLTLHSNGFRPPVQPMLSCLTALVTPQRINSLESFVFSLHSDCDWEDEGLEDLETTPENFCITFETLSPLAAFRSLRTLSITLHNQISIDDDELAALARSWPLLEDLWLSCGAGRWPWALAKYVTLRGLLVLIEACPRVCNVSLPIDARVVPMDASPDIRSTAIQSIGYTGSLISEPRLVAEFFQKHLPSLKDLSSTCWGFGFLGGDTERQQEYERLWTKVKGLLWWREAYFTNASWEA